MEIRDKGLLWLLTFPFAHNNFTAWDGVIYKPKNANITQKIVNHELIHLKQQKQVGKWKFLFLYLLAFPVCWNPWRYQWELEAFIEGSKLDELHAKLILKSWRYGWLFNG